MGKGSIEAQGWTIGIDVSGSPPSTKGGVD
jgi:hypothetical protein